jgi:hypothetical protein
VSFLVEVRDLKPKYESKISITPRMKNKTSNTPTASVFMDRKIPNIKTNNPSIARKKLVIVKEKNTQEFPFITLFKDFM